MSKRRGTSSNAAVKFLKRRVQANQGISLQELSDQLSRLPPRMRTKYGTSAETLKEFLRQFPKVFVVGKQGKVYVRRRTRRATSTSNGTGFMATTSQSCTDEDDVTCLTDVTGKVYRIFSVYGFISVEYPINASVYFDVKVFENAQHKSLRSSGLRVGDRVTLDAKVGPKECEARFRASRVTRAPVNTSSSSPCNSLHSDNGGVRRNTVTQLVNQYGVIVTVKPNYGFIKFGRHHRERAFFHADTVNKPHGQSVKHLPDVFTVGDKVRFDAKRIKKPSGKVRWEATAVHLCRSDDGSCAGDSEGQQSGNEVFMSDEEYEIQDLLQAKLDEYESREADPEESPAVSADSSNSSVKGKKSSRHALSEWEGRRKLAGERGFFYPVSESVGTVKFGPRRGLTATAAVEVTYREMKVIDNLLWEVADGQEVRFDAVQAEDNKWIATLVWIGQRPANPLFDDAEGNFNRIPNKIFGRKGSLPRPEPGPSGDFEREKNAQNVSPESSPAQLSISIYKDAKGTIVKARKCTGTCEVRERTATRKIEFVSGCFYKNGTMFQDDLNEGLREGDTVFLDYMGRRPSRVWQMSAEEFGRRLQIDAQDSETSLCFEDLETEAERAVEASRGPSRAPSDTELPEDTVPSMASEASSSVSVGGLLATLPAATSTPAWMQSPGAHNGPSTCEGTSELSFISDGVDKDVIRRLARMAAVEFVAQEESRLVAFRNVGGQTVEGPSSWQDSELRVPAFVNASTQTISTGAIKSMELFIG
ncbi:hypothetical protein HPB48_000349 [Haemaphysalis longicornis]|uniref:Egal-1 winged helix domain-containing protein n=1 Tax=Haemaphysalis longicornis TaxID=44386 RepID=A0A9J6GKX4_HAELO|nr:hypothetical protein HPB48_000349 [Haemaphysalis longicornis]